MSAYLYYGWRCLGVLIDRALMPLSLIAFIIAAVHLEQASEFTLYLDYTRYGDDDYDKIYFKAFYTIPTFFRNFEVSENSLLTFLSITRVNNVSISA